MNYMAVLEHAANELVSRGFRGAAHMGRKRHANAAPLD